MKHIVMHTTACGPKANFLSGQSYGVDGEHLTKEQAAAFVEGRYASYETAVGAKAPETTDLLSPPGGSDKVSALLALSVAKLTAGLASLSDEELQAALDKENAADVPRRGALAAIEAELEERTKPA